NCQAVEYTDHRKVALGRRSETMRSFQHLSCLSLGVLIGCAGTSDSPAEPKSSSAPQSQKSAAATFEVASPADAGRTDDMAVPRDLLDLFKKIDGFGRSDIGKARYVRLTRTRANAENGGEFVENDWGIDENKTTLRVYQKALLPWTYGKESTTTLPASWGPAV